MSQKSEMGEKSHLEHGSIGLADEKRLSAHAQINTQARTAIDLEHELTVLQALKVYPKAIFWSLAVSMCVVMEGYDTILIGNFFAYPTFKEKYGTFFGPPINGYQLSASYSTAVRIDAATISDPAAMTRRITMNLLKVQVTNIYRRGREILLR